VNIKELNTLNFPALILFLISSAFALSKGEGFRLRVQEQLTGGIEIACLIRGASFFLQWLAVYPEQLRDDLHLDHKQASFSYLPSISNCFRSKSSISDISNRGNANTVVRLRRSFGFFCRKGMLF